MALAGLSEDSTSELSTDDEIVLDSSPPNKQRKLTSVRKHHKLRRKSFKQMYRKAWEKDPRFKHWLSEVQRKPHKAFCRCCHREMTAVITTLIKHESTAFHQERVKALQIPAAAKIDSMIRTQHRDNHLTRSTELRLAAFIAEHNLAFHIMDHFSDLLPKLCPDSKIASEVKCKRTKTKSIINNVMAPHFHRNLVHSLKKAPFSLIIDETTDISTKKELALVTRQYNKETGSVSCSLYGLMEQPAGDAESIFQSISSVLANDGIPLSNVVGFAADTTNVMFGQHNSVVSRLKEKVPHIFTMRCICHSAHLCASHACEKLPRTPEDLIHDVYNYFAHSAKRQTEFQKFQFFANVEPHKILKRCQTRWLSLHSCVQRLIEQWDALTLYFQSVAVTDNLLASQKIISQLQNPIWQLYFHFLNFVLPKFTELNLMFQSSKMSLHCLSRGLATIYKDILSCYMSEMYWKHQELKDIDPTSEANMLPLTRMYMGTKVALLLVTAEYKERRVDVQYFLKKVQEFYIEASCQIKQRFAIGDPVIDMFQVLDPNVSRATFPSLVPLASSFPNIIPESKLQKLDDEWRKLALDELPFESKDMEPEEFWSSLLQVKDGAGFTQFQTLCNFMSSILSFPHANVDVERIFSSVNLIKTKTRNRLKTGTVRSLLIVKGGVKSSGGCVSFSPSPELEQRMTSNILYTNEDDDGDSGGSDAEQ